MNGRSAVLLELSFPLRRLIESQSNEFYLCIFEVLLLLRGKHTSCLLISTGYHWPVSTTLVVVVIIILFSLVFFIFNFNAIRPQRNLCQVREFCGYLVSSAEFTAFHCARTLQWRGRRGGGGWRTGKEACQVGHAMYIYCYYITTLAAPLHPLLPPPSPSPSLFLPLFLSLSYFFCCFPAARFLINAFFLPRLLPNIRIQFLRH